MEVLVIKFGALGDVVRTSYFAKALKERFARDGVESRIHWLTAPGAVPLLRFNPYIDVISTNVAELQQTRFGVIYSLDDEFEILQSTHCYPGLKRVGAYLDAVGERRYCALSAPWFDMGLLSVYGKEKADALKKGNRHTHAEIFAGIFETAVPLPHFFNSSEKERSFKRLCLRISGGHYKVAINAFAGKRWPSKSLQIAQFVHLIEVLLTTKEFQRQIHLFLLGGGEDVARNRDVASTFGNTPQITVVDTSEDILDLAALIHSMDALISSDSLAMHLAIAQQIPTVCFFSSTSAAEIEALPYVEKVVSTHVDYCNYKPYADNSSITAERLLEGLQALHGRMEAGQRSC